MYSLAGTTHESDLYINQPASYANENALNKCCGCCMPLLLCFKRQGMTILGYLALVMAQFSAASVGPMFTYLEQSGLKASTAVCWRCQAMFLVLFPPVILEWLLISKESRAEALRMRYPELPRSKSYYMWICAICWAISLLIWVNALEFLATSTASIITSMTPLLLAVYYRFTGTILSHKENWGIIIAFIGMVVAILGDFEDANSDNPDNSTLQQSLAGGGLCVLSATLNLVNQLHAKKVKKYVPLFLYGWLLGLVLVVISIPWAMVADGAVLWSREEDGIFGWTSKAWLRIMLEFAAAVSFLTVCGYNYAIQNIPLVIFSTARLIDPFLTGLMSWMGGLEGIPGKYVWIGGFVTTVGGALVIYGEHQRSLLRPLEGESVELGPSPVPTVEPVNNDVDELLAAPSMAEVDSGLTLTNVVLDDTDDLN
jgi:drug/metabolite transporter (DMT)-like permease